MPSWLLLLNDSGVPLFSRSYGLPSSAFSFPTMGLLSAVHSSSENSGFVLNRLSSHDAVILYRQFVGGLILVLATSDIHCEETQLNAKIQHMYDALIFLIGRQKLQDLRHVERTKRQIRTASSLLSLFLMEDVHLLQMGSGLPECCIASNPNMFQHVKMLAQACNTTHAAFYAQNRLYAWTDDWTNLDSRDLFTISCFLRSCTPAHARDVPVYLAHSSLGANAAPNTTGRTPYRLLTISLVHELELVLLCGPQPGLNDALQIVQKAIVAGSKLANTSSNSSNSAAVLPSTTPSNSISTVHQDILDSCIDFPRHLPSSFSFPQAILGFVFLVNYSPVTSSGSGSSPDDSRKMRTRIVTSFLANAPFVNYSEERSGNKSGRTTRTPSPSRSGKRSSGDLAAVMEPPSPSQFAPNNPLFSSSLLAESTVMNRSHSLLAFYHLVLEELFPTSVTDSSNAINMTRSTSVQLTSPSNGAVSSVPSRVPMTRSVTSPQPPTSPHESAAPSVNEAYMLATNRGFYAVREGSNGLFVMLGDKVPQNQHSVLTWELMKRLQALSHRLSA